jgi:glutamine synthetase
VGIRVPYSNAHNRRLENRVIGADANPYVALAATLACGYLGMVNQIEPLPEMTSSAYDSEYQLPESLNEAVRLLGECPELEAVLGKRFCGIYKAVKIGEVQEFMKVISPWEREHLLLHV